MSALDKIAYALDRRDEVPNQELAQALAAKKDRKGIQEIADNLWNKDKAIQSDCLKVLYEIGFINPALVADYALDFIKLLSGKNNRLVWGAMIGLSTVADLRADEIYKHRSNIVKAMETGSVITVDNAVKVLALAASSNAKYSEALFPILLKHLQICRPKDVPQHAEKTLPAVNDRNKDQFVKVLEKRMADMTGSRAARVKKVIKQASMTR
jgi:hypothetical protein